jgi:hypothetical protein
VAGPFLVNPFSPGRYYSVNIYRLICATMLGILTYDGNLLIIDKRRPQKKGRQPGQAPPGGGFRRSWPASGVRE